MNLFYTEYVLVFTFHKGLKAKVETKVILSLQFKYLFCLVWKPVIIQQAIIINHCILFIIIVVLPLSFSRLQYFVSTITRIWDFLGY